MVIDMNEAQVRTVAQMQQVLQGTDALQFHVAEGREARYRWIASVLVRVEYRQLKRAERGVVREYLRHLGGYSRAQVTRLIAQWMTGKRLVARYRAPAHAFTRRYTAGDVALLAEVDRMLDTLSGPATACVLRRQRDVFDDPRFVRLGSLSPAHLYNLRGSAAYRKQRIVQTKTRGGSAPTIGVRKAPAVDGRPGFIRIDSVHQGDLDGVKGLYHINAVDCRSQWQVVASVEAISEAYLLPVIEQMLQQFPFTIIGFHADNGSEYVNHRVAALLDKLRVEFTRSRPRKSNDNALVESKNGAVVRKIFGYEHIPQRHAQRFNAFCAEHLNPFLNFHRPCLYASERPDPAKPGRIKRIYRPQDAMTPFDKLASLANVEACLRPGITLQSLHRQAHAQSDLQAADALNRARNRLLESVRKAA